MGRTITFRVRFYKFERDQINVELILNAKYCKYLKKSTFDRVKRRTLYWEV